MVTLNGWVEERPYTGKVMAAVLLLILLIIFFWRVVFLGEVLLPVDLIFQLDPLWRALKPPGFVAPGNELLSDQVYQFYPWTHFAAANVAQGRLPLWNPYSYAGQPFLANAQSALFSPFRLFTYLLPLPLSFGVSAIVQLFIAGFFTFLFTREIKISLAGALLAMLAFTFSAPVIVWLGYPLAMVYVWLPAVMWLTERLVGSQRWLYVWLLALVIGFQFLGGNPEPSFHLLALWFFYLLYRLFFGGVARQARAQLLGKALVALLLGTAVAAVQLLPFLAYLPHSSVFAQRTAAGGFSWRALFLSWQNWPDVITAALPKVFGSPVDRGYWYPFSNYNRQNLYAGILPLVLALVFVFGLLRRKVTPRANSQRTRTGIFFALVALFTLGIALRWPLLAGINELPLFNLAMNGRLRIEYAFALAVLSGLGVDHLWQTWSGRVRGTRDAVYWFSVLMMIIAVANLVAIVGASVGLSALREQIIELGQAQATLAKQQGNPLFPFSLEYYYQQVERRYQQMRALYSLQTPVMFLPLVVSLFSLVLVRLRRLPSALAATALLLVTAVDLLAVHMGYHPTLPEELLFPQPEAIAFLPEETASYRVTGVGLALMPNSSMLFNLADVRGYDPMTPQRYLALVRSAEGYARVSYYVLLQNGRWPLLDLLNVTYLLADQEVGGRWQLAHRSGDGVRVYHNPDAWPRAFVVHEAIHAQTAAESLGLVVDPAFDFRQQVVLEGTVEMPPIFPENGNASATIVAYEPNRVLIETTADSGGYLVLTDTYAPGWRVQIDGQEAQLLIANHAFRAVALPAGRHQVAFVYRPVSVLIGTAVSGAALLIYVLGLGWIIMARRRGRAPGMQPPSAAR